MKQKLKFFLKKELYNVVSRTWYLYSRALWLSQAVVVWNIVPEDAMQAYGGVEIYIHSFLTSARVGASAQLHSPAALHRERARYVLNSRFYGPQSLRGFCGEEMNLIHPPRIEQQSLDCLARSLVTKRTTLPWLLQFEIQIHGTCVLVLFLCWFVGTFVVWQLWRWCWWIP